MHASHHAPVFAAALLSALGCSPPARRSPQTPASTPVSTPAVETSPVASPPPRDTLESRDVVPGVVYRRIVRPTGPWVMHVLEVALRRPELAVRAVRACDAFEGRERPSDVARRLRAEGAEGADVVAVLNADFFDLQGGTGTNENNLVIDGELVKGVPLTESPFDTFDNAHTQFAVAATGAPLLERFRVAGVVRARGGRWPVGAVNAHSAPAGALTIFTPWFGATTRRAPARRNATSSLAGDSATVEVALERIARLGDSTRYRVLGAARRGPGTAIPMRGAVLAGRGAAGAALRRLRAGDEVTVAAALLPHGGAIHTLVGGWPRIVRAGRSVAAAADSVEGTFPRFSRSRHPRSVVGISRDSATLFLVAVEGRRKASVGMSLEELADAMLAIGAFDALNLDGGGSTALVVGDSLVSAPSDAAGERPVGNVLVVTRGARGVRAAPATGTSIASCVRGGNRDPDRTGTTHQAY